MVRVVYARASYRICELLAKCIEHGSVSYPPWPPHQNEEIMLIDVKPFPLGPLEGIPESVRILVILGSVEPEEIHCHIDNVADTAAELHDLLLAAL